MVCLCQGLVIFLAGKHDVHVTAVSPHKGKGGNIQAMKIMWHVKNGFKTGREQPLTCSTCTNITI